MIRVAIVEDDAEVQGVLQEYVRRYTRQYGTEFEVTVFADGVDILEDYRAVYDIIFLDVEMKHLDGMTTAERIRQMDADVILIFITNMAQYAIRGYSVGALDYVLKPVPYFAFSQQLLKAVARLEKRAKRYLTVPVEGGLRRLDTASIYYLESEGHRVHFYTDEGDFSAPGALKTFEEKLADCPFARCNSRYHELKVQIADIRAQRDRAKQDAALAKMENSILQYEAENKTGNPVLDILLTAKSMECQEKQIRMTSVADGHLLDHLSTREICTLVGTALDNAIESCAAEQDPEKRLIRTAVYAQNGFVLFRVENYCKKPVELGADGLPLRSAHGGYDLRSLRAAAQQHGGSMTVHWEDGWFTLRVLLPQAGIQQTEGGE